MIRNFLRLFRPHQLIKNAFVAVGLWFGGGWNDCSLVAAVVQVMLAFCLLSGGVYILNDFFDRERDRRHPRKKHRPLAAGTIGVPAALATALLLIGGALMWAAMVSKAAFLCLAAYVLVNLAYSVYLKQVVLLDIFLISAGFMLRILSGTWGVGIPPSQWLLLCGIVFTLFLGFSKRRAELSESASSHREVLADYSPALLDSLIGISAACSIVTYALWTVSPETIAKHPGGPLLLTTPIVVYGILRNIYLLHRTGRGSDPAKELWADRHISLTVALWLLCTYLLVR